MSIMSTMQKEEFNEKSEMIVKRVSVPTGLEELMEGLTKEVILRKPKDLYLFASEYFSHLIILRDRKEKYKASSVRSLHSVSKISTPPKHATFTNHLSKKLSIKGKSVGTVKRSASIEEKQLKRKQERPDEKESLIKTTRRNLSNNLRKKDENSKSNSIPKQDITKPTLKSKNDNNSAEMEKNNIDEKGKSKKQLDLAGVKSAVFPKKQNVENLKHRKSSVDQAHKTEHKHASHSVTLNKDKKESGENVNLAAKHTKVSDHHQLNKASNQEAEAKTTEIAPNSSKTNVQSIKGLDNKINKTLVSINKTNVNSHDGISDSDILAKSTNLTALNIIPQKIEDATVKNKSESTVHLKDGSTKHNSPNLDREIAEANTVSSAAGDNKKVDLKAKELIGTVDSNSSLTEDAHKQDSNLVEESQNEKGSSMKDLPVDDKNQIQDTMINQVDNQLDIREMAKQSQISESAENQNAGNLTVAVSATASSDGDGIEKDIKVTDHSPSEIKKIADANSKVTNLEVNESNSIQEVALSKSQYHEKEEKEVSNSIEQQDKLGETIQSTDDKINNGAKSTTETEAVQKPKNTGTESDPKDKIRNNGDGIGDTDIKNTNNSTISEVGESQLKSEINYTSSNSQQMEETQTKIGQAFEQQHKPSESTQLDNHIHNATNLTPEADTFQKLDKAEIQNDKSCSKDNNIGDTNSKSGLKTSKMDESEVKSETDSTTSKSQQNVKTKIGESDGQQEQGDIKDKSIEATDSEIISKSDKDEIQKTNNGGDNIENSNTKAIITINPEFIPSESKQKTESIPLNSEQQNKDEKETSNVMGQQNEPSETTEKLAPTTDKQIEDASSLTNTDSKPGNDPMENLTKENGQNCIGNTIEASLNSESIRHSVPSEYEQQPIDQKQTNEATEKLQVKETETLVVTDDKDGSIENKSESHITEDTQKKSEKLEVNAVENDRVIKTVDENSIEQKNSTPESETAEKHNNSMSKKSEKNVKEKNDENILKLSIKSKDAKSDKSDKITKSNDEAEDGTSKNQQEQKSKAVDDPNDKLEDKNEIVQTNEKINSVKENPEENKTLSIDTPKSVDSENATELIKHEKAVTMAQSSAELETTSETSRETPKTRFFREDKKLDYDKGEIIDQNSNERTKNVLTDIINSAISSNQPGLLDQQVKTFLDSFINAEKMNIFRRKTDNINAEEEKMDNGKGPISKDLVKSDAMSVEKIEKKIDTLCEAEAKVNDHDLSDKRLLTEAEKKENFNNKAAMNSQNSTKKHEVNLANNQTASSMSSGVLQASENIISSEIDQHVKNVLNDFLNNEQKNIFVKYSSDNSLLATKTSDETQKVERMHPKEEVEKKHIDINQKDGFRKAKSVDVDSKDTGASSDLETPKFNRQMSLNEHGNLTVQQDIKNDSDSKANIIDEKNREKRSMLNSTEEQKQIENNIPLNTPNSESNKNETEKITVENEMRKDIKDDLKNGYIREIDNDESKDKILEPEVADKLKAQTQIAENNGKNKNIKNKLIETNAGSISTHAGNEIPIEHVTQKLQVPSKQNNISEKPNSTESKSELKDDVKNEENKSQNDKDAHRQSSAVKDTQKTETKIENGITSNENILQSNQEQDISNKQDLATPLINENKNIAKDDRVNNKNNLTNAAADATNTNLIKTIEGIAENRNEAHILNHVPNERNKLISQDSTELNSQKETNSALKIQSLWRGFQVRKSNEKRIASKTSKAIILLQSMVRGYLQRKKYKTQTKINVNSTDSTQIEDSTKSNLTRANTVVEEPVKQKLITPTSIKPKENQLDKTIESIQTDEHIETVLNKLPDVPLHDVHIVDSNTNKNYVASDTLSIDSADSVVTVISNNRSVDISHLETSDQLKDDATCSEKVELKIAPDKDNTRSASEKTNEKHNTDLPMAFNKIENTKLGMNDQLIKQKEIEIQNTDIVKSDNKINDLVGIVPIPVPNLESTITEIRVNAADQKESNIGRDQHEIETLSSTRPLSTSGLDKYNNESIKDKLNVLSQTDAVDNHVDLLDQVQNTLLDQICGKSINDSNKQFHYEELRNELHDAARPYKKHENEKRSTNDELLQYLTGFESTDNVHESRISCTPNRELPDILEEDAEIKDDNEIKISHQDDGITKSTLLESDANANENKPMEEASQSVVDRGSQTANQQPPGATNTMTSSTLSKNDLAVSTQTPLNDSHASSNRAYGGDSKSMDSFQTFQSMSLPATSLVKNSMESETLPGPKMEDKAATRIQAGFRGYQVRKQLKAKKPSSATDKIINQKRSLGRRKSAGTEIKKNVDLEEKSAVKIQAGVRGFLVRRRQKKQIITPST